MRYLPGAGIEPESPLKVTPPFHHHCLLHTSIFLHTLLPPVHRPKFSLKHNSDHVLLNLRNFLLLSAPASPSLLLQQFIATHWFFQSDRWASNLITKLSRTRGRRYPTSLDSNIQLPSNEAHSQVAHVISYYDYHKHTQRLPHSFWQYGDFVLIRECSSSLALWE